MLVAEASENSALGIHEEAVVGVAKHDERVPGRHEAGAGRALIGADAEDGGLQPWNVVEGDVSGLGARDAVMIDKTYLAELGVKGVGDTAQVGSSRVRVAGLTEGIRSFTVTPFVFTTLNRARQLIDMPADNITYVLVKVRPGANVETVRQAIRTTGARLLFLPPYSPDLNPIEQVFAKLKHLLRAAAERTREATWRRIGTLLDRFPPDECAAYLRNSGYGAA